MAGLGELIEGATPEIKAAIQKLLSSSGKSAEESAEVLKGLPKDYPPINPKSAAESAETLKGAPDVQNFQLKGQPYSGKVPATIPEPPIPEQPTPSARDVTGTQPKLGPGQGDMETLKQAPAPQPRANEEFIPVGEGAGGFEEVQPKEAQPVVDDSAPQPKPTGTAEVFDPTQDQSKALSEEPEGSTPAEETPKQPMSLAKKAAIGTGVAGLGLAGAMALQKEPEQQAPGSQNQSTTSPAARHVTGAEPTDKIGDELDQAQDEDFDLKNDKGGGVRATKAPEAIDPKEAQMRNAISSILNFGGTNAGPNALDKAIAERREMLRYANMNEGLARIGAGIARVTPDLTQFEQQKKQAQMPLEEYALRQKNEENDPNSGISSGLRDYIKQLGVNVSDNANAAQIKQVLPMVWKDIEAKQAQAARSADLQNRLQVAQINKQAQLAQANAYKEMARQDKLTKQGQDQYNKGLQQAESVRGNKAIQNDMQTINRVQNAKSIISMYPDPNKIPPNMLSTFDADMATIMMGGVPGEGVMHEVASPTVAKSMAQFAQKWSNAPVGARAAAFINQYGKYFDTLGKDAQDRIDTRFRRIGNTTGMNWSPDQKQAYLNEYFPNGNHSINSQGQFVHKSLYSKDVMDYAISHNITPDKALAIKNSRQGQ